jgi:hypothetical protein
MGWEEIVAGRLDEADSDLVHQSSDGTYCKKGVKKVISDDGTIVYECAACGKRWSAGESAQPD